MTSRFQKLKLQLEEFDYEIFFLSQSFKIQQLILFLVHRPINAIQYYLQKKIRTDIDIESVVINLNDEVESKKIDLLKVHKLIKHWDVLEVINYIRLFLDILMEIFTKSLQ